MSESNEQPKIEQEIVSKPPELDPYLLFKQIDQMREEGVPEETIKEAFNQFMQERQGNFRKVTNSRKRTPESVPMPSQAVINKMYEDEDKNKVMSPEMELLMTELDKAKDRRIKEERPSIRKYRDKMARFVLIKLLRFVVWSFGLIGVK